MMPRNKSGCSQLDQATSPGKSKHGRRTSDSNLSAPISSRTRSSSTAEKSRPVPTNSNICSATNCDAKILKPTKTTKVTVAGKGRSSKARKPHTSKRSTKIKMASVAEPMDVDSDYLPTLGQANHESSTPTPVDESQDHCAVCMCPPDKPKKLDRCGHIFCTECIDQCFAKMNPVCPICGTVYGQMTGNMPRGSMDVHYDRNNQLPGHIGCGTIVLQYNFPDGTQTKEHPHPGKRYYGTRRVAFLPDNDEGRKVLGLFRRAFDARMMFTVGRSATTGLDDQVIWNDIHHKTRVHGGPTAFGYPDPTYLNRVQEELASKGIR